MSLFFFYVHTSGLFCTLFSSNWTEREFFLFFIQSFTFLSFPEPCTLVSSHLHCLIPPSSVFVSPLCSPPLINHSGHSSVLSLSVPPPLALCYRSSILKSSQVYFLLLFGLLLSRVHIYLTYYQILQSRIVFFINIFVMFKTICIIWSKEKIWCKGREKNKSETCRLFKWASGKDSLSAVQRRSQPWPSVILTYTSIGRFRFMLHLMIDFMIDNLSITVSIRHMEAINYAYPELKATTLQHNDLRLQPTRQDM